MLSFIAKIALLLLGSGCCALLYQLAWLRLLRLVFGSSTAASGVVLGIFMGGLGLGAWWLGKYTDRSKNPLLLYSYLELGVAVFAALSGPLIMLARWGYVALGGSTALGTVGGTFSRLFFSALLLGIPTFLMGGTLPAAVRAVEQSRDLSRRFLGLIYGMNTLGAVLGAFIGNFFFIEIFGIQKTLLITALANALIFLAARKIALEQLPEKTAEESEESSSANSALAEEAEQIEDKEVEPAQQLESPDEREETEPSQAPHIASSPVVPLPLLLIASFLVGFVFLLMELVWYRMMGPLLGGSSYSFGVILIIALFGIGIGSLIYSSGNQSRRPTLYAFVWTCTLEACFLIIPFAWGDSFALWVNYLISFGEKGFWVTVSVWMFATTLAVLPAAIVSGYQFPLLVSLLGVGRERVGKEVGMVYASNTIGAISGSLLGGLVLFPLLTALGIWRALVIILLVLAGFSLFLAWRMVPKRLTSACLLMIGTASVWMCTAQGPTAFWRHNPIGLGYVGIPPSLKGNDLKRKIRTQRRKFTWEAEGVESSIGLSSARGYAFYINGKNDGHSRMDAPQQVMSGLLGAILHVKPERVLVVGLGTGSTAGWLAKIPTVKRVDVVELEPAVVEVTKLCRPVNHNVLSNPKVRVVYGDARETLLSTPKKYDLIVSIPSNPYRAGISSLFTQDFYRAVYNRLRPGGILTQWLQSYKVNAEMIRMSFSTLRSVFPHVELWAAHQQYDLLFVAGRSKIHHDIKRLRSRTQQEPYRSAMKNVWGIHGLEGLYTSYVLSHRFADAVWEQWKDDIHTDDLPQLEFAFSRSALQSAKIRPFHLRQLAKSSHTFYPEVQGGKIDWEKVDLLRHVRSIGEIIVLSLPVAKLKLYRKQLAIRYYNQNNLSRAAEIWDVRRDEPVSIGDLMMAAEILIPKHPKKARMYIQRLQAHRATDAAVLLAFWYLRMKRPDAAIQSLNRAFQMAQKDPWASYYLMNRALRFAKQLAKQYQARAKILFATLATPFSLRLLDEARMLARIDLAATLKLSHQCTKVFEALEPHFPWEKKLLKQRLGCYQLNKHPLQQRARTEYLEYLNNELRSLDKIFLNK